MGWNRSGWKLSKYYFDAFSILQPMQVEGQTALNPYKLLEGLAKLQTILFQIFFFNSSALLNG